MLTHIVYAGTIWRSVLHTFQNILIDFLLAITLFWNQVSQSIYVGIYFLPYILPYSFWR